MNCKICGTESGKYPLCLNCNKRKEKGEIIKCSKCNQWHLADFLCEERIVEQVKSTCENLNVNSDVNESDFLYSLKPSIITKNELNYFNAIKSVLSEDYLVFPQMNLAAVINKAEGSRYHTELFRNVDFIITDSNYKPLVLLELNDQSHTDKNRKERDQKVKNICEEAGIPLITLWTSYGVKPEYIKRRIDEAIASLPLKRIPHHKISSKTSVKETNEPKVTQKSGCYIATCVYGSYDCPQVWTLRRYRDTTLASTWYGRCFIKIYYSISPQLVKWFGSHSWFKKCWKHFLDSKVQSLQDQGVEDTPYIDF